MFRSSSLLEIQLTDYQTLSMFAAYSSSNPPSECICGVHWLFFLFSPESLNKTLSSANINLLRYFPTMSSHFNFFYTSSRHAVNNLGEFESPCITYTNHTQGKHDQKLILLAFPHLLGCFYGDVRSLLCVS